MKNRSVKVLLPLLLLAGCSTLGQQLRQLRGGVEARLAGDVWIERDAWGVPHIRGGSDEAVAFGVAWAMAEDDFRGLEEGYLQAVGRFAYYYGERYLAEDLVRAAFRVEAEARAEYEREPEATRRLLQGFAHGLNYYLRRHPERPPRVIGRYEPWMVLARARWLTAEQRVGGVRLAEVAVIAGAAQAGSRAVVRTGPGVAWAVSPGRSTTGRALLLASVESPFSDGDLPYELELRSKTGWHVRGLARLGIPVPFSGHNDRLGWASAGGAGDSGSLRKVVFDHPTDSLAYRSGGGWKQAVSWVDTVRVNTAAGVEARPYRFLRTADGPVLARRGDTAYVAHLPAAAGGSIQRWLAAGRARSLAEFLDAVVTHPLPGTATAYADVEGNILAERGDGGAPVVNPAAGEVRVGGAENVVSDSVRSPPALARLALGAMPTVPAEQIGLLVHEWEQIGGRNSGRAFAMDTAIELLRRWNGSSGWRAPAEEADSMIAAGVRQEPESAVAGAGEVVDSAQSAAATLYHVWRELYLAGSRFSAGPAIPGSGAVPAGQSETFPRFRALEEAVAELRRDWGTVRVPWNEFIVLARQPRESGVELAGEQASARLVGIPDGSLFVLQTARGSGPGRYAVGGTAAVMVTEFTVPPQTRSVAVFGQSADPASGHYFDQAPRYGAGALKQSGAAVAERYRPGRRARLLRAETPAR